MSVPLPPPMLPPPMLRQVHVGLANWPGQSHCTRLSLLFLRQDNSLKPSGMYCPQDRPVKRRAEFVGQPGWLILIVPLLLPPPVMTVPPLLPPPVRLPPLPPDSTGASSLLHAKRLTTSGAHFRPACVQLVLPQYSPPFFHPFILRKL